MSILDADIINQELPFDALPDACLLQPGDRNLIIRTRHMEIPKEVWIAKGAELVGLQVSIWPCPYSKPHGVFPDGYVMYSALLEQTYNPNWGAHFPQEDFFSSYIHMDEIIQRHTCGMLNLHRLIELNRIYNNIN